MLLLRRKYAVVLLFSLVMFSSSDILAQTEFSYQGTLNDAGQPANNNYDFEFRLFAAVSGGSALATQQRLGVSVAAGVFTVQLDFGSNFPGASRFIEIGVRPAGSPNPFTVLSPRRQITSAPYAIRSISASLADNAANAANATLATNASQLGGAPPSEFVRITDSRLTDARSPTAGSSFYIQNTAGLQAGANFNISGNGTAGGTLSANSVNGTTDFRIGGGRVFSIAGIENLFVGLGAGNVDTLGGRNSFFGKQAGAFNTTGSDNSFFGYRTGISNTTGSHNSIFGAEAGEANTQGDYNSFFGYRGGKTNTVGIQNAFYGAAAGEINNTGSFNAFFGAFTGWLNSTGDYNSFFGAQAGRSNDAGQRNTYVGFSSGYASTSANDNAYFGYQSGDATTTGSENSFFGSRAGDGNTAGNGNSYFGYQAGSSNLSGGGNAFFGYRTGFANFSSDNSFFGHSAGLLNSSGFRNVFVGTGAGSVNSSGNNNTFIGYNANPSAGNLSNATAVGSQSLVTQSNSLVLGNNVNVGIGTSAPKAKLDIRGGSVFIAQPNSLIITSPNGACWFITVNNSGILSTISVACPN